MTSVFTARRRAEEFHNLVEDISTGRSSDVRFAELVDLVGQLRALEQPAPRPDFTVSLRAELMSAADTLLVPSADTERLTLPGRPTPRDRRLAVAVGGLAIVGATTSLAVAAQSALPGEMLYPLKRMLEQAETQVQTSQEAKAASLLDDATTRLHEATELSRGGDLGDVPAIADSFTDFADQAQQAAQIVLDDYAETGDKAPVEKLNAFTSRSMDTLARLEGIVPTDARDELLDAARVLEQMDADVARACPSCRGGITQIPPVLLAADQETSGSTTVVVPGTLLPGTGQGEAPKGNRDTGGRDGSDTDGTGGTGVTGPLTGGDGVTTPPATGGSGSDDSPTGPLEDLTGDLLGTGGGGDGSGGGGGGATTDNGGLDDTVDGLGDTVEDTVDDVTDGLDDITDGLP